MLVLDRKRLSLIVGYIFVSIFAFMFMFGEKKNDDIQSVPTVSLPISGKTVVIDAGHGVPDERCRIKFWNNRSGDKFENSIKIARTIRAKWMYCNTYSL